jgi:tRNA-2-methylthio-N6-dimethylallyladenosine synthase
MAVKQAKGRVVDCGDMGNLFDIGVERLMGGGVDGQEGRAASEGGPYGNGEEHTQEGLAGLKPGAYRDPTQEEVAENSKSTVKSGCATGSGVGAKERGTFYLETFGCQMNEHDSEKVAGVLLARGYRQVETVDAAGVVLYNTCSIREKAAQKVYSRLGEFRPVESEQRPATGDRKRNGEWRVAGGEQGGIPQGLKPSLDSRDMSDLKVRPPKEKKPQDSASRNENAAPSLAEEAGERLRVRPASEGGPYGSGEEQTQEGLAGLKPGAYIGGDGDAGSPRGGKIIGVLGCLAQQEGERIFARAPWVNLVCGSASYRKLPQLIAELEAGNRRVTGLDTDTDETFETEVTRRDNPWRAYLTIIEGCDKACSYCVVPFTRGPERSRASASILEEVRKLADAGYTEVQLLGQTVNSYADPSGKKMRFSELLVAVAGVTGIRRVRFTTSHPRDFEKDIVEAIEAVPGICEHVHLPVQSGSTKVLRAMARTYSREEYLEKVAMLRAASREISLTTDIIVGFPGETEKDFEETLSLLEAAQYDGAFAFKYSPRPNTPSLKMGDAIPEEEKSRRLGILIERQREIQRARNERLVGETFEVMVEGKSKREQQWSGHTSSNKVMNFTSRGQESLGDYVRVRVVGATPNSLVGERV